ncbi:MAG: pyrroline-5-carboxylate reductase [Sphingobacteriia bacterium]
MHEKKYKIGLIGAGNMGQVLLAGLLKRGTYRREDINACTKQAKSARALAAAMGIHTGNDPREVVLNSELVILAVKPYMAERVLQPLQGCWDDVRAVVSIMTGVPISFLEEQVGRTIPVYRAMPNTPATVGQGMTVIARGSQGAEEMDARVEEVFQAVGHTAWIEEDLMNASTGLSGAGPAYVYLFIEAMSDAGVKVGIPRDLALLMAAQTVKGAAEMVLASGMHPAQLKDQVTTPAGVTIDGIMEMEDLNLRSAVIRSVVKATERAYALFKQSVQ